MSCAIGGGPGRRLELVDRAGLQADEYASLAALVASHLNLQRILAWLTAPGTRAQFIDSIAQDEYTHDLVVQLAPERWLVYDSG